MGWFAANWTDVVVPLLVVLMCVAVGFWLRLMLWRVLSQWMTARWARGKLILDAARNHFLFWFLLLGLAIVVEISLIPQHVKDLLYPSIGTLFVASLTWLIIAVTDGLIREYMPPATAPRRVINILSNIVRVTIIIVAVLTVFELWRFPTTPLLLLAVLVAAVLVLVFREPLLQLVSLAQISALPRFREGDLIRMDSGEEGYVEEVTWSGTRLRTLDGRILSVPHDRMLRSQVVNFGRPVKRAKEPFEFMSHGHLTELTGMSARNLDELLAHLREASEPIIYYHTHNALEEHFYLVPETANDFAVWVSSALGDDDLGEQLASVDTFSFPNLTALRDRLVGIIQEHIAGQQGQHSRDVEPGREFFFMKSVSVILQTRYRAADLREFVEALRNVGEDSIYFHMFEARLRLERGQNDFSAWLETSLGESDLAREIARLDPYTYSLEGLRSALLRLCERQLR